MKTIIFLLSLTHGQFLAKRLPKMSKGPKKPAKPKNARSKVFCKETEKSHKF